MNHDSERETNFRTKKKKKRKEKRKKEKRVKPVWHAHISNASRSSLNLIILPRDVDLYLTIDMSTTTRSIIYVDLFLENYLCKLVDLFM